MNNRFWIPKPIALRKMFCQKIPESILKQFSKEEEPSLLRHCFTLQSMLTADIELPWDCTSFDVFETSLILFLSNHYIEWKFTASQSWKSTIFLLPKKTYITKLLNPHPKTFESHGCIDLSSLSVRICWWWMNTFWKYNQFACSKMFAICLKKHYVMSN